jgi:hypothetical protein
MKKSEALAACISPENKPTCNEVVGFERFAGQQIGNRSDVTVCHGM